MRITNSMMMKKYAESLSDSLNQVDRYSQQVTSGTKFTRASEDPTDAVTSLKLLSQLSQVDSYKSSASTASTWLQTSETSVKTIDSILQSASETVTAAKNGTNTDSDLANYAKSLTNYQAEILQTLNQTSGSQYVFGGSLTGNPPFKIGTAADVTAGSADMVSLSGTGAVTFTDTDDGVAGHQNIVGLLLYNIPNTDQYIPVSDIGTGAVPTGATSSQIGYYTTQNSAMSYNSSVDLGMGEQVSDYQVAGGTAMNVATSPLDFLVVDSGGTTTNLYDQLGNVVTQLDSGDSSGLGDLLSLIGTTQDEESKTVVEIGSKEQMCTFMTNKFTNDDTNLQSGLSSAMDVDSTQVITNYIQSQAVYQAAQSICSNVMQHSLFDFLK